MCQQQFTQEEMKRYRLEWFTSNGKPFLLNNPHLDKPINIKVYNVTLTNDTINVNGWQMKLNHVSSDYTYRLLKTRIDVSMWFMDGETIFSQTLIGYGHEICEHVIKYGKRL